MSAKTASMVIPTRRNGSDTSQTNGRRMSASTARGQDSANKIHQPRKMKTAVMVILCSFLPRTSTARRKTLPPCSGSGLLGTGVGPDPQEEQKATDKIGEHAIQRVADRMGAPVDREEDLDTKRDGEQGD